MKKFLILFVALFFISQSGFCVATEIKDEGIRYFKDEAAIVKKYESSPTAQNAKKLAEVRKKYAKIYFDKYKETNAVIILDLAKDYANSARFYNPDDYETNTLLGMIYSKMPNSPTSNAKAIGAFELAAKQNPRNCNLKILLANEYLKANEQEKALSNYEKAILANNSLAAPDVIFIMTMLYSGTDMIPIGISVFNELYEKNPKKAYIGISKALLQKERCDFEGAADTLNKVLKNSATSKNSAKIAQKTLQQIKKEEVKYEK